MLSSNNKSNSISSKLDSLRSLSETISEVDLALIEEENSEFETIAISAMKSTPRFKKKDLEDLGIDPVPNFMLDRSLFASDMNKVRRFRAIKKLTENIDQKRDKSPSSLREVHNFAIDLLGIDDKRFFDVGEAIKVNRIVKAMLSRHPHQAIKIYYDFKNNVLTSIPDKGECLQISNISVGYKNGHCGKLTQKMNEGKSFIESMIEIIKFDLKKIYLKLSQMEHFSFADYRRRKVPLILVDEESIKMSLKRWEIRSIQSLLMDRDESEKQIIAEIVKEMVLESSKSLYLWK